MISWFQKFAFSKFNLYRYVAVDGGGRGGVGGMAKKFGMGGGAGSGAVYNLHPVDPYSQGILER